MDLDVVNVIVAGLSLAVGFYGGRAAERRQYRLSGEFRIRLLPGLTLLGIRGHRCVD